MKLGAVVWQALSRLSGLAAFSVAG